MAGQLVLVQLIGVRVPHLSQKYLRGGMVDTSDLGSDAVRCESSSLSGGTKFLKKLDTFQESGYL